MNIPFSAAKLNPLDRARGVRVVLGPTNTGKTHYAMERMLGHASGMIGLPLRLLAREVYNSIVEKLGAGAVALITGEEKIKPKTARYFVSTVEAMPRDLDLAFVAVDEIQLAGDLDRGHIFTDRLLNRRGSEETLLVGASTMQRRIEELLPGAPILSRPRLSKLSFAGSRKISRLPRRTAIVAFSVEEVYAIAEWIRRQRGGAAVVLGALSPRTRNAQVEIYQSGDVDYIVATDAIGMGLNLDVDHIAFASDRKFDGWQYRRLTPAEFGQIAGRAGRHMREGTFGTTGRCAPFEPELVEALEEHRFEPLNMLQWRNTDLDLASIPALLASLDAPPKERSLTRAPLAEDQMVLEILSRDEKVGRETKTRADVARLWDTCQIPDYRKLSPGAHAELVLSIYGFIIRAGHIPEDWLARHISELDRVDGNLDTLSARIAQVRTWTFIANRPDWLRDPEHWQGVTRQVEDTLSDALHERLAQRFVDRRTSVLMRRLRENAMLEAEITTSGDVLVEDQHVGHLSGFRFAPDPQADGEAAKALNAAAQKALASEIEGRARRVHEAVDEAFVLANDGIIRWLGEPIGKIAAGEKLLEPRASVLADEQLTGPLLEMVQRRLDLWLAQHVKKLLGPLIEIEKGEGLEGIARGIGFRIAESLGVLERAQVAEDVKNMPQEARAALRKLGVRFGAYHLYVPALMRPAPRAFAAQLWALRNGGVEANSQVEVPHLAASGRTSFIAEKDLPKGFYRAAGFHICGDRAVRVDILERLADLIRPAVSYRPGTSPGEPPPGAADSDGFVVTVAMTSLAGCAGESFASILRSLGYVSESRKGPAISVAFVAQAASEPVQAAAEDMSATPALSEEPAQAAMAEPAAAQEGEAAIPTEVAAIVGAQTAEDAVPTTAIETSGLAALAACEAQAETASAEETAVPLIEVWRPYRQPRRDQRPKYNGSRRSEAHVPRAPEAGAASPRPEQIGEQAQRPERKHVRRPRPAEERTATGRSAPETQAPRSSGRKDRGRDRQAGEAQRHGNEAHRPWASTEKPRESQPDPNSPFAKLLVLKQQMETRGKT
jgi:ATP-dependent RNA helicase SUPV3L1/SUV3